MKGVITVSVTGSMRPVIDELEKVQRQHVPAAAVRALNRTSTRVRTAATKELAAQLNIPVKLMKPRLPIAKASRRRLDSVVYLKHIPINPMLVSRQRGREQAKKIGGFTVGPGESGSIWVITAGRSFKRRTDISFSKRTKSGQTFPKLMVFKRQGKKRLPLWGPHDQKAPDPSPGLKVWPKGEAVVTRHIAQSREFFTRTFERDLQFRIDRERGKL